MAEIKDIAQIAARQKRAILDGQRGGYTPSSHELFRVIWPRVRGRMSAQDARDAAFLHGVLHAHVNGDPAHEYYMWAWPTVKQLREETGIHGNRIKPLIDTLEAVGLLVTKTVAWRGNPKKIYCPLYYVDDSAEQAENGVESDT